MISWRRVALALSGLAVVAAVLAAALLKSTTPGGRGQAQIVALNQQVLAHFRSRSYREAQSVAEQVVAAVKARSGEQHADHIKALIQLAQVLIADKRAPEAEPILNRALELARATLPADAPLLADALQALGSMLGLPLGKGSDGTPLLRQALAIREKNIKADPPAYLDLVARLADIYTFATGDQAGDVQGLMARAIDLAKDDLGDRHPVVAALLAHLAEATRFRQPGTHRAAGAMEAEQGRGSDSGRARMSQQWHEAEKYNALSRAILDEAIKSGTVDSSTKLTTAAFITALSTLAYDYQRQKRFAEAERVFLLIRDMRLQEVNARYADALGNAWHGGMRGLLRVYDEANRPQDYDATAERLTAYYDREHANSPSARCDYSLNEELADHYEKRRDFNRADGYWKKRIAACEAQDNQSGLAHALGGVTLTLMLGVDGPLHGFAGFNERHGRWAEAEAALRRAIDIYAQLHGPDSAEVRASKAMLDDFLDRRRGISGMERFARLSNPGRPNILDGYDKMLEGYDKAALARLQSGEEDYDSQVFRAQHAFEQQHDWKTAFESLSKAAETERADREAGKHRVPSWTDASQRPVSLAHMLIKAAWRLGETETARRAELLDTTFVAAQRSQLLAAGTALAQMAAREASGNAELAGLLRERESLSTELDRLDQQMKQAVLQTAAHARGRSGGADSARMDAISQRLAAIDATVGRDFPGYLSLARPQPLTIAEVQAILRLDEALVVMVATPALGPDTTPDPNLPAWIARANTQLKMPERVTRWQFPPESFVWVVTKTDARWVKADLSDRNIAHEIFTLRCGLDAAYWEGDKALRGRCEMLLKVPQPVGEPPPFHVYRAYEIYRALFGQVEDLIQGKQLLIAPTGPFTVLPYQVLVTAEPGSDVPIKAAPTRLEAYEGVAWLGTRQPITVLPSVASLKHLRERARSVSATKPFIGFGNPLLTGRPDIASHRERAALVQEGLTCGQLAAPVGRRRLALEALPSAKELVRDKLVNVDGLRQQLPLPETAGELCTIAQRLGAADADVRLGARMTETEIKALSRKGELRDYRVLHFATHGLVASDAETVVTSGAEPALMFTPPEKATEMDDGLLTASEVTQLELDADWVVMSACRTAAGEASESEALSGLARAFFYAGATALLVSHWAVDSDAAVAITTGAFEALAGNPAMGKAEALRRSIIALQKRGGINLHPATWAPFSLVGGEAR